MNSCCNNMPHYFDFKCESHYDRVWRDVKESTARTGYDFEKFADFMFKNRDYCIQGFPRIIGSRNHTLFNTAIHARQTDVYVINSERKRLRKITKAKFDEYVNQWLIEADQEKAEQEKNMWREKLKSVGVDVQW